MKITKLLKLCVLQFSPDSLFIQPLKATLKRPSFQPWPMACALHDYYWRGVNQWVFTLQRTDRQTKEIILPKFSLVK